MVNLQRTKQRYDDAITRSTSGKKLNNFSDNPSDMAYVLNLRNKVEQTGQFIDNIQTGSSLLDSAESALNSIQNQLYSIITLAEDGANESNGPDERAIIADEVNRLRDSMLSIANTQVLGRYVFAGTETGTRPFVKDPGEPDPDTVLYIGNPDTMEIQADFTVTVETNVPGNEAFGTGPLAPAGTVDIFQRLADLRDALLADDTGAIGNSIGSMHQIVGQVNESLGRVGNRSRHLEETLGMLKDFRTSLVQKMSSLEDADMARAISDLKKEEVGLQATLQTGSRINNISLFNFLK